jgi:molybdopterin molybdotransferase
MYMISVGEARKTIASAAMQLPENRLSLLESAGHILAEDVHAPLSIPAYPQSSMDGYALFFDGGRWPLKLIGEMAAGSNHAFTLKPGEAVRIFTGAAVPDGANTVLMQEKARIEEGLLYIEDPHLSVGTNVRPVGSEIERNALALPAGTLLTPAAIGFLAGIGITEVSVFPMPKVSIIVTGNELQTPGNPLEYGQVFESNSWALLAALKEIGITPLGVYRCGDDLELLTEVLLNALEDSDVVLMTGGVSVGDYDFTSLACEACGVQKVFHKIKQKPGKPILFGIKGDKLIFGLPGNPASVLTCYYQYVLAAFSKMSGKPVGLKTLEAPLVTDFKKPEGLTHFLKGYFDGVSVTLLQGQESYKLNSFAKANCLAEIPEGATSITAGEKVTIHLFS